MVTSPVLLMHKLRMEMKQQSLGGHTCLKFFIFNSKLFPMKCFARIVRLAAVLLLLAANPAISKKKIPASSLDTLLSISDLHFNPFYDPALVDKLITADYKSWQQVFASSANKMSDTGQDSNFRLLYSALSAMRKQEKSPAFILISGDFLCHDFSDYFNQYASPQYGDSLQSFTAKTIQFIAHMLDTFFPKTVVLPVLGNNDSYCGDYSMQPNGPFLSMFARAWVGLQRNGSNKAADSNFVKQFSKGGYYTFPFPGNRSGKMILLNTVFYAPKYSDCGSSGQNAPEEQISWLDSVMKPTQPTQQLWMMYHIPPGIDIFKTVKTSCGCNNPSVSTMWGENYIRQFLTRIQANAGQIKAAFAGHTHMDDFKVIYQGTTPVSFIHITPSISPYFKNNPGFQRITYNPSTMMLQNAETFYLNLEKSGADWTPEYNFAATYDVQGINAKTLDTVRGRISGNTKYRQRYIDLYDVSNPYSDGVNKKNWMAFWCGTGALLPAAFTACCTCQ
jgi:sphingomyelin phosphodiesterase acid-like 3